MNAKQKRIKAVIRKLLDAVDKQIAAAEDAREARDKLAALAERRQKGQADA